MVDFRRLVIGVCSVFAFTGIFASNKMEWEEKEADMGIIFEKDGPAAYEFKAVNKGKKPVKISDVKVSCGCTQVDFPKEKINRGDTVVVTISYDPSERPGKFDKGIYVFYQEEDLPETLRIKGVVVASDETLRLFFPEQVGQLHFDTLEVDFGELGKGMRRREFIDLYNSGMQSVAPVLKIDSEAFSGEIHPAEIKPGETATITLYVDASKLGWPGEKNGKIGLEWDNGEKTHITYKARLLP